MLDHFWNRLQTRPYKYLYICTNSYKYFYGRTNSYKCICTAVQIRTNISTAVQIDLALCKLFREIECGEVIAESKFSMIKNGTVPQKCKEQDVERTYKEEA